MDPGTELGKLLRATATVKDLVADRIYPIVMPETAKWPLVVHKRISGHRDRLLSGQAFIAQPHYQLDCWALKYDDMVAVSRAVAAAVDGYRGTSDDGTPYSIGLLDDRESFDEGSQLYQGIVEVIVNHPVPVPT